MAQEELLANAFPDKYYSVNQYGNPDNECAHHDSTGNEIFQQTNGAVTHFVMAASTGGTIMGVGRCLKLLPKSECPRVPDLPLRCDVAPMNYTCEADGECGTDGGANNCGGFDLYVVTYIAPGDPLRVGPRSPWTSPHVVALSGPGAPVGLTSDHVTAHGLTLHWEPPADESAVPALARRGVWHAHGGGRLLGYRIYARAAHEPLSAMRLVGSTTELSHTLRLPSQTLWRFRVAAESHVRRGLNSTELIVATGALRATLWTRCGYKTSTYHADSYEGCYREQRAPEAVAGRRKAQQKAHKAALLVVPRMPVPPEVAEILHRCLLPAQVLPCGRPRCAFCV